MQWLFPLSTLSLRAAASGACRASFAHVFICLSFAASTFRHVLLAFPPTAMHAVLILFVRMYRGSMSVNAYAWSPTLTAALLMHAWWCAHRSFWKYVKKLDRREARRYLEMFYILLLRPLIAKARPNPTQPLV